ncbi:MAG: MarR family transcriptional regulator [Dehalococcoidales bacterium]|nr:MAG: MarR family transcriptional regulator [Dehalococcoidales bacterium]
MNDYAIWGKITEVYYLISKARSSELEKQGLTPEQSQIIRVLIEKGGTSSITEISEVTLRRHNTTSLIIKRMEKAGFVRREKIASSNRYQIIITEKGIRLFETMPLNSIDMIFSKLSSDEKEALVSILDKLDKQTRYILGLDYIPPLFR